MRVSPHSDIFRKISAAHKRLAAYRRERELEQLFDFDECAERIAKNLSSIRCASAPQPIAAIGASDGLHAVASATNSNEATR